MGKLLSNKLIYDAHQHCPEAPIAAIPTIKPYQSIRCESLRPRLSPLKRGRSSDLDIIVNISPSQVFNPMAVCNANRNITTSIRQQDCSGFAPDSLLSHRHGVLAPAMRTVIPLIFSCRLSISFFFLLSTVNPHENNCIYTQIHFPHRDTEDTENSNGKITAIAAR